MQNAVLAVVVVLFWGCTTLPVKEPSFGRLGCHSLAENDLREWEDVGSSSLTKPLRTVGDGNQHCLPDYRAHIPQPEYLRPNDYYSWQASESGYSGPTVANISYITKNTIKIDSINVKMGQILFMLWTMVVVCVFIGVALGKKTQHQHTRHPRTLMDWKSLGLANLVLVTLPNKFSLLVIHHLLFHQEIHLHPSRNHCFMIIHYKVTEPLHWIWKYVVYICGSWRLSGLGA